MHGNQHFESPSLFLSGFSCGSETKSTDPYMQYLISIMKDCRLAFSVYRPTSHCAWLPSIRLGEDIQTVRWSQSSVAINCKAITWSWIIAHYVASHKVVLSPCGDDAVISPQGALLRPWPMAIYFKKSDLSSLEAGIEFCIVRHFCGAVRIQVHWMLNNTSNTLWTTKASELPTSSNVNLDTIEGILEMNYTLIVYKTVKIHRAGNVV